MFVTPRYGDGALTDLVPSVLGVLGVAGESDRIGLGVDGLHRVAILLIDGMGAEPRCGPPRRRALPRWPVGADVDRGLSQHHGDESRLARHVHTGGRARHRRLPARGPGPRAADEPAQVAANGRGTQGRPAEGSGTGTVPAGGD